MNGASSSDPSSAASYQARILQNSYRMVSDMFRYADTPLIRIGGVSDLFNYF